MVVVVSINASENQERVNSDNTDDTKNLGERQDFEMSVRLALVMLHVIGLSFQAFLFGFF